MPAFPISARRGEGIDALLAGARHAPVPRGGFDPRAVAAASIATTQCESRDDRIDRIVLRPYVGLPLVLLSVAAALYLSFGGVGMTLKAGFDALLDACIRAPLAALCTHFAVEPHLASFLLDGVCAGVLGVLGFLPQVALLFLCLSVFEDSGLAARMAFLCDPLLSRLGLSGRAFFPLCVGFGCTVPAVMAARVASPRERWVLYFCLPFVCCPARVPVFALITAALFPAAGILPLLLLYGLGLAAALLAAAVLTRIGGQPSEAFVMELPPYRLPHPRTLLAAAWEKCRDFLFRAGTLIFLAASAVWLLENLGPHGFVSLPTDSFLYRVGSLCAAPLAPLGFGNWESTVTSITGLVAKENVVATVGVITSLGEEIGETDPSLWAAFAAMLGGSSAAIMAFCAFNLLCAPCFAAIGTIRRQMMSAKWTWAAIGYMCAFAWCVGLMIYQFGGLIAGEIAFGPFTALAIVVAAGMLYLLFRPAAKPKGAGKLETASKNA